MNSGIIESTFVCYFFKMKAEIIGSEIADNV